MKVKELMQTKVKTVSPEDKVDKVFLLFNFERIRHLPVVEKKKVVGIVSDRDLKKMMGSLKTRKVFTQKGETYVTLKSRKVKTFMSRGVVTISPNAEAVEAAALMAKRKIGGLPVVKGGVLVGIITATDILRAYVKLAQSVGI
ncbi:MAG TPA: CBS domain-containing protein [Nitrospiria bacterium]|jgi:acetoin utilization protein AcuB